MLTERRLYWHNRSRALNPKFWSRLGGEPVFKDQKVLDVGCGSGNLCVDIALQGAKKVIGIDINERGINFANEYLKTYFPQLSSTITYHCHDITQLHDTEFDMIVSKDTFEHIINLESEFPIMQTKLKQGGRMYIGVGPLYYSLRGDHTWTQTILPWGHIFFSEELLVRRLNKRRQQKLARAYLGLNKLTPADYQALFQTKDLTIKYFKINAGNHPLLRLSSILRVIPQLTKYFSVNLYCILEKSNH